ncbi:hypothetical protein EON64_18690 [archaeon]|nr:MAG: hypothetical protein EON64_18690 [archaeon]
MMVGSYYCFDIPAALKTQIEDYMGNPSDYEIKFGLLYTLYAAPNVGYSIVSSHVGSCQTNLDTSSYLSTGHPPLFRRLLS